jgi:hypothetical protein
MDYAQMAKSALSTGLTAAAIYFVVNKGVGQMLGNEYLDVFVGMGLAAVIGPGIVNAIQSQTSPTLPTMNTALAQSFVYGGAIGLAGYYVINMIKEDMPPIVDVGLSAAITGALVPMFSPAADSS